MADLKISQLNSNTAAAGDEIPINRGGVNFKITAGNVSSLVADTSLAFTNKTISVDNNNVSGIAASSFVLSDASGNIDGSASQKAIPTGVVVGTTDEQTLTSKSFSDSVLLFDNKEKITVSGTGANATINFDVLESQVYYSNANATGNWTLNIRGNSSTTLNTVMAANQSITVAVLAKQGATAYINNVVQVDGSTVSALWQGGSAPSAGNTDSTDVYIYNVLKTANATFTVLASQTKFKA
jgi:hypothetical protein